MACPTLPSASRWNRCGGTVMMKTEEAATKLPKITMR